MSNKKISKKNKNKYYPKLWWLSNRTCIKKYKKKLIKRLLHWKYNDGLQPDNLAKKDSIKLSCC